MLVFLWETQGKDKKISGRSQANQPALHSGDGGSGKWKNLLEKSGGQTLIPEVTRMCAHIQAHMHTYGFFMFVFVVFPGSVARYVCLLCVSLCVSSVGPASFLSRCHLN